MITLIPLPNLPAKLPASPATFGGSRPPAPEDRALLKRLIWTYFWLLIIEGALRKWVLPSLANPLLIIRDPLVILIYAVAVMRDVFPKNGYFAAIAGLGVLSALASELAGHGNLLVTLYGVRTDFLHLPLIFVLPKVFGARDIEKVGKWILIVAFPMALLVVAQFRASPDSRLNVGVGGSIGSQLSVGFGKIRPPGTFSFNTGLLAFLALAAAYILSIQMRKDAAHSKLALASLPAVGIMVAVSGSRSTLGAMAVILIGAIFICIRRPIFFGKAMKGVCILGLMYFALSFFSDFQTGLTVHEGRLEEGGGLHDGILMRVLDGFSAPFVQCAETPMLGEGLGMGTNAGAGLLTGDRGFLLAEAEWERIIMESGAFLGFSFIGLRIALLVHIGWRGLAALQHDDPLPLLIFFAVAQQMLNGTFSVPTTLGFAVFGAGLSLAAAESGGAREGWHLNAAIVQKNEDSPPKIRGRSVYAEQLHGI